MVHGVKSVKDTILAITAMAIALGVSCKKPDEPAAKTSYEELSSAVKANSEAIAKMHDDVVALHAYIDGVHGIPMVKYGAPPLSTSTATLMPSTSSDPVRVPRTPTSAAPSSSAHQVAAVLPPDMPGPRPPIFQPRGFGNAPKK